MRTLVGQVLAVQLVEQRLVVEQVELRRPAGHEQVDDALRLRREVRRGEDARERIGAARRRRAPRRSPFSRLMQRDAAEAEAEPAEEVAAVHASSRCWSAVSIGIECTVCCTGHRRITASSRFSIALAEHRRRRRVRSRSSVAIGLRLADREQLLRRRRDRPRSSSRCSANSCTSTAISLSVGCRPGDQAEGPGRRARRVVAPPSLQHPLRR